MSKHDCNLIGPSLKWGTLQLICAAMVVLALKRGVVRVIVAALLHS